MGKFRGDEFKRQVIEAGRQSIPVMERVPSGFQAWLVVVAP
jgi:hypothetical protein